DDRLPNPRPHVPVRQVHDGGVAPRTAGTRRPGVAAGQPGEQCDRYHCDAARPNPLVHLHVPPSILARVLIRHVHVAEAVACSYPVTSFPSCVPRVIMPHLRNRPTSPMT